MFHIVLFFRLYCFFYIFFSFNCIEDSWILTNDEQIIELLFRNRLIFSSVILICFFCFLLHEAQILIDFWEKKKQERQSSQICLVFAVVVWVFSASCKNAFLSLIFYLRGTFSVCSTSSVTNALFQQLSSW